MNVTKIICTLGPSSKNPVVLKELVRSGMDVARLNFSHGSHKEHLAMIKTINDLNKKDKFDLKILQDLEGYRIRVGTLKNENKSVKVEKGDIVLLTNKENLGDENVIPFDYDGSLNDIDIASNIYIDDGYITLKVKSRSESYLKAEVIMPGIIKEHKGINIPNIKLKFTGLTGKDKDDLRFGLESGVDFIAQSFVRTKEDILDLREFISAQEGDKKIIAKIENREGLKNIDEIIDVSDGIMIARGDLGVSIPIYEIPIIQKMIIKKCNDKNKFVITATQMLDSMTENIRPTRAEVTDVANSIIDGTDYVMLSGETAVGKYPVETIKMMSDIIEFTERFIDKRPVMAI